MKRIHKERDRLLRRLARVAGFVGTASALACLLIPGVATPAELAVGSVICVLVAVLVGLSTARGALLPAVGVVAGAIAFDVVLGSASVLDAPTTTAMAAMSGVAAASVALPVVVRRRGGLIVAGLAGAVLATV